MRAYLVFGASLLAACHSTPSDSSTLILNDPYWDRVNVEIVVTRRADCDSRDAGFVSGKEIVMRKNTTERFTVPNGANICWRHDRNPNEPVKGAWSGWTKASIPPGQETETDL
jgi:hypothetical protein